MSNTTSSTATTVAIFMPVIFLENEAGQLFSDLAVTISAAVVASLLVAVTVIPLLSYALWKSLPPRRASKREGTRLLDAYTEVAKTALRNRAVTDVFEPGSTIKPFVVAAGLESGQYRSATTIDTSPGLLRVGRHTVRDMHDYGVLDMTGVLRKSSNVAATKIALALEPEVLWESLSGTGFGVSTGSGFPGEADGYLADFHRWREIERATLSYGYGLSATAMQLAQAYGVLAKDGYRVPVTLLSREEPVQQIPVFTPAVARAVRTMMESVVKKGGTAPMAAVQGYRVAGKTGTVHKSVAGGYADDRYLSVFAGMAPASRPRSA